MKKTVSLICVVLALLLVACGQDFAPQPTTEPEPPVTTAPPTEPETQPTTIAPTEPEYMQAPDFTVYDENGDPVKLSDYLGTPVVLNFWASWCGPCKMEMPDFQKVYEQVGDQVQFMIVNLTDGQTETVETASGYIAQMGYTFPVLYDQDYDGAIKYSIYSIPTTVFIDRQGRVLARHTGMLSEEALLQGIDLITQE